MQSELFTYYGRPWRWLQAGQMAMAAGIELSLYVILGIAG